VGTELAGDLGDAPAREQREMIAEDTGGERVAAAFGDELLDEGFSDVLAADAGGIEGLEELDRLLDDIERQVGLERDVGGGLGQKAPVIQAR
jgi:hypothetical protein